MGLAEAVASAAAAAAVGGLLLGAPVVSADYGGCPDTWKAAGAKTFGIPGTVHEQCFWVSPTDHTFESCQVDVCGPMGGTLACIPDESINSVVMHYIGLGRRGVDVAAVWIGLTDAGGEDWHWINGCGSTYTRFLPGEPDNYCGGEDCVAMTGAAGGWMDASCRIRLPCLCEYGGAPTHRFKQNVMELRDDTCYADCGDLTKWCSAWPFARLYDVNEDVCHWEEKDGQKRGRGASECANRVKANPDCGTHFTYSVGDCRCSPAEGIHTYCMNREVDPTSDVFVLTYEGGVELEYARQRCIYSTPVDTEYFSKLKPATTFTELFRYYARAALIWWAFGLPCVMAIFVTLLRTFLCCRQSVESVATELGAEKFAAAAAEAAGPPGEGGEDEASYGPLLETEGEVGVGDLVNRWVYRGAIGSIVYGLGLLALGATLAMHMAGAVQTFGLEVFCALVMAIAMATDARAATQVHRRLSPVARQIVGHWVLVLSVAKYGLAITAFCGVIVFSTLADRDYENVCFAEYMFRWSMLLALPLFTLSGFAISRVQVRSEPYVGSLSRMEGWVPMMIVGSFCSGAGIWLAGYLDCVHELFVSVALCFIAAATAQLTAGMALLKVNRKVKELFKSAGSKVDAEGDGAGGGEGGGGGSRPEPSRIGAAASSSAAGAAQEDNDFGFGDPAGAAGDDGLFDTDSGGEAEKAEKAPKDEV